MNQGPAVELHYLGVVEVFCLETTGWLCLHTADKQRKFLGITLTH